MDGDGTVECLVRGRYQGDASGQNYSDQDNLVPLGETAILTGPPFWSGEPIGLQSAVGRTWQRAPLLVYRVELGFIGPIEQYRVATPIGLQFAAAVGVRLAWLRLWDVADDSLLTEQEVAWSPDLPLNWLAVSPEGRWRLLDPVLGDVQAAREVRRFEGVTGGVSTDGVWVLTRQDHRANLWGVSDGSLQATLEGHAACIQSAAFSADSTEVVTGGEDRTAPLWRVNDGSPERTFEGHADQVPAVAISPDGQRLLTGTKDKTSHFWSLAPFRGNESAVYPRHQSLRHDGLGAGSRTSCTGENGSERRPEPRALQAKDLDHRSRGQRPRPYSLETYAL